MPQTLTKRTITRATVTLPEAEPLVKHRFVFDGTTARLFVGRGQLIAELHNVTAFDEVVRGKEFAVTGDEGTWAVLKERGCNCGSKS